MKKTISLILTISILLSLFGLVTVYAASISVDKTSVQTGETVTATFSISLKEYDGGWIGLYKKESGDGDYICYKKITFNETLELSDNTYQVKVYEPGSYEFRMFKDYFGTKKVATASFNVVFSPTSTVSASPSYVETGKTITAKYTISKIDGEDTSGWVAFYKKESEDASYITYKKTGGTSGTYEVIAPDAPGEYDFRLYKDYFGTYKLAVSNSVTVVKRPLDYGEKTKAFIVAVQGEVGISPDPNMTEWKPVTLKTEIHVGDHISCGADSSVIVQFEDMTRFVMQPGTEVVIATPPGQQSKLELVTGHLWVNTKKMLTNGTMEVEMGQAVAGIKGTTFICERTGGKATLKVIEGIVQFTARADNKVVIVSTGESVTASAKGFENKAVVNSATERSAWRKFADVTPPPKPNVKPVTTRSTTVTGTSEAGSIIMIKSGGTVIGKATSNTKGVFIIPIKKQKLGTVLEITALDKGINASLPVIIKVIN